MNTPVFKKCSYCTKITGTMPKDNKGLCSDCRHAPLLDKVVQRNKERQYETHDQTPRK